MRNLHPKELAMLCGVLVIGMVIGWILPYANPTELRETLLNNRGAVLYQGNKNYIYIDPLLSCDVGTQNAFPELQPLNAALTKTVAAAKKQGNATEVSVYVRLLKSARWTALNLDQTYAPASLMKVFVLMAYYREDNDLGNGSRLNQTIIFKGNDSARRADTPGEEIPHLVSGAPYTIERIIEQMIIYSDNDAMTTLIDNFSPATLKDFQGIFTDLGIPEPPANTEQSLNFMPVDRYAMVFRVLFGSTYLSRQYSEKALALLGRAHYADGIVAGVPTSTTVAHKFGIRSVPVGISTQAELHDCGIVYYPARPYLLCVMTKGNDFIKLQGVLQEVSKVTYQQLDIFFRTTASTTSSTIGPVALPR